MKTKIFLIVLASLTPAFGAPSPAGSEGAWWSLFQDSTLDRLEDSAIKGNQDLRQSISRVVEARAEARAVESGLFPSVTAPLAASRQRTTNTGPVTSSRIIGTFLPATPGQPSLAFPSSFAGQALANTYDDFQVPLEVGYEVDVFGRIRHAYGQARANAEASLADRQGVRLSLTTQVAATYFALRAVDSKIAVLNGALHLRADAVQIQQQRVKAGEASDIDFLRARVEYANTEADLPDAMQERAELENSLAELCGRQAGDFQVAPAPLELVSPPPVPATISAQVLAQRPDLLEAEHRIAAAGEGVKASRAQFLPSFRLQAGYGYESAQASQLLEEQSRTWALTGAISIPIFEGGKNTADLNAAKARNEEALAAYQVAADRAFREAENALSDLRQRARQADSRRQAVDDARRVFEASQRSYREGAITYFEVIDAQRVLLNAELGQVETLNARYAATIDLIKAAGGAY